MKADGLQNPRKKRRVLPKTAFSRFGLVVLALLTACAAPSSGENPSEDKGGVVVQVPTSTEVAPAPTSTPTTEPTPTEVVEVPSANQEALLNDVFPLVREAGCEPTYEVAYYPEYANSIPWTVDASGNMVQGITELNFCGAVAENGMVEGPILALATVEKNPIFGQNTVGPNFGRDYVAMKLYSGMPEKYVGFLMSSDLVGLENLLLCMQTGDEYPDRVISLLVPTNPTVFLTFGAIKVATVPTAVQNCL